MPTELHRTLRSLHEELTSTRAVDDESRELLVTVMQDIARVLDRSQQETADTGSLKEQLETVAVQFESEHPRLSSAVRQVVDALAKAGI
ncbi:MAG TPA: DUF4404 family protein [Steroidobacteraceae bacterium]|nr:DUF4404 family protein [Steroidobacteraceae bacterium]